MDEETTVPEEELVEEIEVTAGEPELGEPVLAEVEEEEDAVAFDVRVFFHTGAALSVPIKSYEETVLGLRKQLEKEYNRLTYGSVCLVNGRTMNADYEDEHFLSPGDIVTFSGSVKGG